MTFTAISFHKIVTKPIKVTKVRIKLVDFNYFLYKKFIDWWTKSIMFVIKHINKFWTGITKVYYYYYFKIYFWRLTFEQLQNIEIKYTYVELRTLPYLTIKFISYSRELLLHRASYFRWHDSWIKDSDKGLWSNRSSLPEVFCKKSVLRNFAKFTGNTCARVSLRPATLFKKRLLHSCFPVKFAKFLRTPFFIDTSGSCFWN